MIPKIIHYCWFGNAKKPKSVREFIKNWHQMLPNYTFMEWNESNCDLEHEIDYVKEAYQCKKYAFVSDYIRIKKLYEYGGIYFDTDVEIIKDFNYCLLDKRMVLGFQSVDNITTAFIASEKNHPILKELLDFYAARHFILKDGSMDLKSINQTMDPFIKRQGIDLHNLTFQETEEGLAIYPVDYFSAFDIDNWHPVVTNNTCTIHYMSSSWKSRSTKIKIWMHKITRKIFGEKFHDKIMKLIKGAK